MRRFYANEYFDELFEATYNEALSYTVATTGTMEYAEDILTKTYSKVYRFLRKNTVPTNEQVNEYFFNTLNSFVSEYETKENNLKTKLAIKSADDVKELLENEFSITELEFLNENLNVNIHSYIMDQTLLDRKIFILSFYCNCSIEKISNLLGINEEYINSSIYHLLVSIKEHFLD